MDDYDALLGGLTEKSCANNTTASYEIAWKIWGNFCEAMGIVAEDPAPKDMAKFVVWMQYKAPNGKKTGYAPTTIRARIAGLKKHFTTLHPTKLPVTDHPMVKKAIDGAIRESSSKGYKAKKMKPIMPEDLAAMIRAGRRYHGTDSLYTIRNEAILTVQWSTGARVSEMTSLTRDNVEPIVRGVGRQRRQFYGYYLTWPQSKSKQDTAMRKQVTIKNIGNPALALQKWLEASHIKGNMAGVPVFHSIQTYKQHLGRKLTERALQSLTRSYLELAGYDPKGYGTHSFRRGLITSLAMRGRTAEYIKSVTKHGSIQTIVDYIEETGIKTEEVMSCFDDLDLDLDTGS